LHVITPVRITPLLLTVITHLHALPHCC